MELLELSTLSSAAATDFAVHHVVGTGQSGLVVAATCTRLGLPDPSKLYAVKLLFNFSHEYSSVMHNTFENEWLVLSRLLPHPNIVRFWSQFVGPIPPSFSQLLPVDLRKMSAYRDRLGQMQKRKGQFLVLDHHSQNLSSWTDKFSLPLPYELSLKMTEQILEALLYLEKSKVRHLDLKPANVLISEGDKVILCDFGSAVQFPDDTFTQPYSRGVQVGGNRAHLAPEVLSAAHKCRSNPSKPGVIDYSKQGSFAAGILVCEVATGDHPLPDYPLGYSQQGVIHYTPQDLSPLPPLYPKSFRSIVGDLLQAEPDKRLSLSEAAKQLKVCCLRKQSVSSVGDLQEEVLRVKQERDLAMVGREEGREGERSGSGREGRREGGEREIESKMMVFPPAG